MTRNTYEPRTLDELVQEHVFDWKWATFFGNHYLLHPSNYSDSLPNGKTYLGWTPGKENGSKHGFTEQHFIDTSRPHDRFVRVPARSTDIAEAFEVQEEMHRRQLHLEYAEALMKEAGIGRGKYQERSVAWLAANATPRMRCLAALVALGVKL